MLHSGNSSRPSLDLLSGLSLCERAQPCLGVNLKKHNEGGTAMRTLHLMMKNIF